jgi:uncharacterized membrane protein YagU involved in acid resistance
MNSKRAAMAGLVGTVAMTALWLVEPRIGLARLAAGDILSSLLAVVTAHASLGPTLGWTLHFGVGILLGLLYAARFAGRLPGSPTARGLLFGCVIFIIAQVVFMPLVGAGVFSRGDLAMLLGSFIGHLVYGGLVGWIYGMPPETPDRA